MKNFKKLLVLAMGIVVSIVIAQTRVVTLLKPASGDKVQSGQVINPHIVETFGLDAQGLTTASSKEFYLNWLKQEETTIWAELEKAIGLSLEYCPQFKENNKELYEKSLATMERDYRSNEIVSPETIQLIHEVMLDFGIDKNKVTILPWKLGCVASATDKQLFVNELLLNALELKSKKFIIGHELTHYINKDHSTNFFVKNIKPIIEINKVDLNNIFNTLKKFQEMRADINSSFKSVEYAQGNISFFNKFIHENGDLQSNAHPKSSFRFEVGNRIVSLLNNPSVSIV